MLKKIWLIIISLVLLLSFSACSYFLPMEVTYEAPELMKSEKVVMPSIKVRRGDLLLMYDLPGSFVPEPSLLFTGEAEINGSVYNIYYSIGDEVKKGDLVMELNTDKINDKIMIQEISVQKTMLNHEQNQVLFEKGKIDKYSLALSELTLEAAQNYLSDLKEELGYHYIYAPSDGVIVNINFDVGDNAFGDAFSVSDVSDGIYEVLIPSQGEMNNAQLEMISMDIGDSAIIIFNGVEYDVELIRDYSTYHIEFGFDQAFNHIHFNGDGVPDNIAFNKGVTVRNVTDQALDVVVIPVNAVFDADTTPYTYVISGEDVEKRYLELGMSDGSFFEVIEGLEVGEEILKIN